MGFTLKNKKLILQIIDVWDKSRMDEIKDQYLKSKEAFTQLEIHFNQEIPLDCMMAQFLCALFREIKKEKMLQVITGKEALSANFNNLGLCEVCGSFELGNRCLDY